MEKSIQSGVRWTFLVNIINSGFGIITTIILLRYISPRSFGLMAMFLPIFSFLTIINSFATINSIVSKQENSKKELNSLFTFKLFISLLLTVIAFLLSLFFAWFYAEGIIIKLTMLYSLTLTITGVSYIYHGLLLKEMRLKEIAIGDMISTAISCIIGVTLAYLGFDIYSLIAKEIVLVISVLSLRIYFLKWIPEWSFKWSLLKYYLNFGKNISLNGILNFGSRNTDDVLIGKAYGAYSLGIYSKAYSLLILPLTLVSKVAVTVLIPRISKIQHLPLKSEQLYFMASRIVLLISSAISLLVYFMIGDLIMLLKIEMWSEIIPLIKFFAILSLFQSLCPLEDLIYQGLNKTEALLRNGVIQNLFLITTIIVSFLCSTTIFDFTRIYVALNILYVFLSLYLLSRVLESEFLSVLKNLIPILIGIIITYLSVEYITSSHFSNYSGWIFFIIKSCCIVGIFLMSMFFSAKKNMVELLNMTKLVFRKN